MRQGLVGQSAAARVRVIRDLSNGSIALGRRGSIPDARDCWRSRVTAESQVLANRVEAHPLQLSQQSTTADLGEQRWPTPARVGNGSQVTVSVTPGDGPQLRVLPTRLTRGRQGALGSGLALYHSEFTGLSRLFFWRGVSPCRLLPVVYSRSSISRRWATFTASKIRSVFRTS